MQIDTGANTEGITEMPLEPISGDGFSISIDGAPVSGEAGFADQQRDADITLSDSDIDVRFDGLGVRPRLDVQTLGEGPFAPGQTVTFLSRMNYPGFVAGGEVRILDLDAPGGARTLAVVPLAPNGEAVATLPQGKTLAYVYRVRDGSNRLRRNPPCPSGHLVGPGPDRPRYRRAGHRQCGHTEHPGARRGGHGLPAEPSARRAGGDARHHRHARSVRQGGDPARAAARRAVHRRAG